MQARFSSFFLMVILSIGITDFMVSDSALAFPVDLTENTGGFVISDSASISFGYEINEAVLFENPLFGVTYLSNDPFLGDPGILIRSDFTTLMFDLEFVTTGSDNFEMSVLDPAGGSPFFNFFHDGTVLGPGRYMYNDVSVDLADLNLSGDIIGIEFSLTSNFGDTSFDAMLNISNVCFDEQGQAAPEPVTILLVGTGVFALTGLRKRFMR